MNPIALTDALRQALLQTPYGDSPAELYEPIRYIMALGGKRMRPLLTLLAASLFADDWQKAIRPALAVEVFHNFTLMHDDIMDQAPLRRGQPTVHERWNANTGILSGDVMLVNAYQLLLDVDAAHLRRVLTRFSRTAAEVCEGQQLDMNFETRRDVTEDEYMEMIRLKTSVLVGFALELGAIIAGADDASIDHLRLGGIDIGLGFQLRDDLLDVYGDPVKFGKQVGGDIISNKKTFMLIEALATATGPDRAELDHWLTLTTFDKAEKVRVVTAIYDRLNLRTLAETRISAYFESGLAHFGRVTAEPTRKAGLLQFTHQLLDRES
jgi:geranylgeranyl diphosphate synthase, type II